MHFPLPKRGYFTIEEAKAMRCENPNCDGHLTHGFMKHNTCRRCGKHLVPRGFLDLENIIEYDMGQLCHFCFIQYKEWMKERDKKLMEEWNNESEGVKQFHIQNGTSPFFGFKNQFTVWIKKHRIITIEMI